MSVSDDTVCAIASDELAGVTGANYTGPEQAKAQVGSQDRCAYVKEHLRRLGADAAFMNRAPSINRNPVSFGNADLKDRLHMEHAFHCRTPEAQ